MVFGNPEVTPGGRALKFYSSVRIDLRRVEFHQAGISGRRHKGQGQGCEEQGRAALPHREFDIMFNRGISKEGDILDIASTDGIIKKAGSFYSYGEVRLGQGRESAKEYLYQHKDMASEVEERIRNSAVQMAPQAVEEEEEEA